MRVWYKFQDMPPALKLKRDHNRYQVPSQDWAFGTKICYPHLLSERHNEPAGGSQAGLGGQRNHCNLNSRFPFYALSAYSSQFLLSQSSWIHTGILSTIWSLEWERRSFYWEVFVLLSEHGGICIIKYLLTHKLEENGGSAIKSCLLVHKSSINSSSIILLNLLHREQNLQLG